MGVSEMHIREVEECIPLVQSKAHRVLIDLVGCLSNVLEHH